MDNHAILCIGSNAPDCFSRVALAIERLSEFCDIIRKDRPIESADVTGRGRPYVNVSLECVTTLPAEELAERLGKLETQFGRLPDSKASGNMPLDADIVVWNSRIVSPRDFAAPYFTMRPHAGDHCVADTES